MIRSLLRALGRRRVLRRRLPAAFGRVPILVSPEAGLRFWRFDLGKTDPSLLGLCEEFVRPGSVVWDVGANVGLFAFAAAARAGPGGRVLALEPDPWLVGLLERSRRLQPAASARVDVLPLAASGSCGLASFVVDGVSRSMSRLEPEPTAGAQGRLVPTTTLDALLGELGPPDLVKIDVEGGEIAVLAGAKRLLAEARPVLLVEVWETHAREAAAVLGAAGYALHDGEQPPSERRPLETAPWSTVAIPAPPGLGR